MTLILTELSHLGIAMAADSAVTMQIQLPNGGTGRRIYVGVTKLQKVPKIQAGVSCWGLGTIQNIDTDVWLSNFITTNQNNYNSLTDFAILLQNQLQQAVPPITQPSRLQYGTIGFHLAGFVPYARKQVPAFYHIHNGRSQYFTSINPQIINANYDFPPQNWQSQPLNTCYITRNGDFQIYAQLSSSLETFFNNLASQISITGQQFQIPYPNTIDSRAEYLRFNIRFRELNIFVSIFV